MGMEKSISPEPVSIPSMLLCGHEDVLMFDPVSTGLNVQILASGDLDTINDILYQNYLGKFDLRIIVVDLDSERFDGFGLIRSIRKRPAWKTIPILAISAKDDVGQKVRVLEDGADGYLLKPFGSREFVSRIRALQRRFEGSRTVSQTAELRSDGIVFNRTAYSVLCKGKLIKLTPIEFKILSCLATNKGKVVRKPDLIREIWKGRSQKISDNNVAVHVYALRKKIERSTDGAMSIETLWRVGYRFQ
jgi:DNA-binding response OmpR family regulator